MSKKWNDFWFKIRWQSYYDTRDTGEWQNPELRPRPLEFLSINVHEQIFDML